MKLKVQNEDFRVKEISTLDVESQGEFGVYTLTKAGWNTVDALTRIARQLGVPYSIFSYGGKKDRHAVTEQTVTARSAKDLSIEGDGYSLRLLGRSNRPMGPDLIKSNVFEITLRALTDEEVDLVARREPVVAARGFPNFFDDQRFGSMEKARGFIAERILKGHWKGALEFYLTVEYIDESPAQRKRRLLFQKCWGDWQACASEVEAETDKNIVKHLIQKPHDYVGALQKIPREELSMLFSAYQSHLWNEMLRRCLRRQDIPLEEYPGDAGPYLFYGMISQDLFKKLAEITLPTAGSQIFFANPEIEVLYDSVLLERGLHRGSFNLRRLRQAYFKSSQRKAIVVPTGLKVDEAEADELYTERLKMLVRFELPRGSYGTMCIKALLTDVQA